MTLHYYKSNALVVVNLQGLIRVLYTPFRVQCISPINRISLNMWVYVEEVLSTKEDELIYLIHGQSYSHSNFKIEVNF
jgi:hypothetical protein